MNDIAMQAHLLVKPQLVYFVQYPSNAAITSTHKNSERLEVLEKTKAAHQKI
jgi:hypothetical protein